MVRTELRALVKVFFKLKEEPQNFFEELRVTVRACDPKVLHLSQLAHMLAGLGKAPKWMQEAKQKTPRMMFKGWEESPEGGRDNLPQYSCLENPHGQRSLAGLQSIESDRVQRVRKMIQSMEFSRPEYWSG